MGTSIWISQSQKTFQLRLFFGLFFFLSLAYAALTVGVELQLILFGSTARASVV